MAAPLSALRLVIIVLSSAGVTGEQATQPEASNAKPEKPQL